MIPPQQLCTEGRARTRSVIARGTNGQPRTYRLAPASAQRAAYRRLAVAILRLDVATLADQLRLARQPLLRPPPDSILGKYANADR